MCLRGTRRRFKSGDSLLGYNYFKKMLYYINMYYVCNAYKLIKFSIYVTEKKIVICQTIAVCLSFYAMNKLTPSYS